jgi:hypothetical protein
MHTLERARLIARIIDLILQLITLGMRLWAALGA